MELWDKGLSLQKLRKMVGSSTLRLKPPDFPTIASPWSFSKRSWEAGYQAMVLRKLLQQKLFVGAFFSVAIASTVQKLVDLSSVATLSEPQACGLAGVECLLFFFSVDSMARARSARGSQKSAAQSAAQLMKQSIRLFSMAVAAELNLGTRSNLQVLESAFRWIVCCSHALPQYEEAIVWFLLVFGWRPVVCLWSSPNGVYGNVEAILFFVCTSGILASGVVISRRRAAWIQHAAGSTVLNPYSCIEEPDASSSELKTAAPDSTSEYDDYFTKQEWARLQPVVLAEGQDIITRAAYTIRTERNSGPTQYEWLLGGGLGAGSYGTVVVVKSRVTGQLCALKRIKHKTARRGVSENTEGSLLYLLEHPHIVRFVDELQMEYETQLLMELCDAGTLSQLILTLGPLDVASARWFTRNIVSGLQYLHQHGISHEDVKPSNCLLHRSSPHQVVAKLADFGAATFKREAGARRKLHGTPMYMAPEVVSGHGVWSRRRMDIWSLGVCVLEMLTARTLLPDLDKEPPAPPAPAKPPAPLRNGNPRPAGPGPGTGTPGLLGSRSHLNSGATRSHDSAVDFALGFLVRLRSDPALPPIPDALAASLARDCLRLAPTARPSAHALATHPFMLASAASCPSDAPAVRHLLGLPAVAWDDGAPSKEARWVLRRLRRGRLFWVRPGALWQWLVELEAPCLHPDMERRFHAHHAPARAAFLLLLLRVVCPVLLASSLLAALHPFDPLRLLAALLLLAALPLLALSDRKAAADWEQLRGRLRLLALLLVLAPPSSVMLDPLLYAGIYASTLLAPYVAEAVAFTLAHACLQLGWRVLLHHDTAAPLSSLLDRVLATTTISLASAGILVRLAVRRRKQERKAFWKHVRAQRKAKSSLPSDALAGQNHPASGAAGATSSHASTDSHTDLGSVSSVPSLPSLARSTQHSTDLSSKDTERSGPWEVRARSSEEAVMVEGEGAARTHSSDRPLASVHEAAPHQPRPSSHSSDRSPSRSFPRPRISRTRSGESLRRGWVERPGSEAAGGGGELPSLVELSTSS